MANGRITRTIVTANAYAWQVNGTNEDGSPKMERIGGVEFTSTKPNNREAFHALKNAGLKVNSAFVSFEVTDEKVMAMSLDEFLEHAVEVRRMDNGRVKEL